MCCKKTFIFARNMLFILPFHKIQMDLVQEGYNFFVFIFTNPHKWDITLACTSISHTFLFLRLRFDSFKKEAIKML